MPNIYKKWLFRAIGQYSVVTISEDTFKRETFHDGQPPIVGEYAIKAIYPSSEAQKGVIITQPPDFANKFNAFPWFNQTDTSLAIQLDNFQFESIEEAQNPEKANEKHATTFVLYQEALAKPFESLSNDALEKTLQGLTNLLKNRDQRILETLPTNPEEFKTVLTKGFMLLLTENGYDRNGALQTFKLTFQAHQARFMSFAEEARTMM
ncbi:hypothetical protein BKI52_18480 [marine bacterium AO1-C]|nr:hypothetical protein BKI52_18480 [marine bacterium AO1-C]